MRLQIERADATALRNFSRDLELAETAPGKFIFFPFEIQLPHDLGNARLQEMSFRRSMAHRRPLHVSADPAYTATWQDWFSPQSRPVLLSNHSKTIINIGPENAYFQEALSWGMWPTHNTDTYLTSYWDHDTNTTWYQNAEEVFKKYIPILKDINTAGWVADNGVESYQIQIPKSEFPQ